MVKIFNDNGTKRNIQPFTGDKHSVWKFRIRSLCNDLNLLDVVDSEPPVAQKCHNGILK